MDRVSIIYLPETRPIEKINIAFTEEEFVSFAWLAYRTYRSNLCHELVSSTLKAAEELGAIKAVYDPRTIPAMLIRQYAGWR
jgi:hypothetical protein